MNSLTMNCMIAVAALAVTAGSASAQVLRAEIPFAFRAGNTLMAPGAYDLNMAVSPSRTYFLLRNAETKRSVMLANFNVGDVTKSWKAKRLPTLGFESSMPAARYASSGLPTTRTRTTSEAPSSGGTATFMSPRSS